MDTVAYRNKEKGSDYTMQNAQAEQGIHSSYNHIRILSCTFAMYDVGISKALLISTLNFSFIIETKKIFIWIPLLFRAQLFNASLA